MSFNNKLNENLRKIFEWQEEIEKPKCNEFICRDCGETATITGCGQAYYCDKCAEDHEECPHCGRPGPYEKKEWNTGI